MKTKETIQKIEQQIKAIQTTLTTLGEMRPGSLTRQYNVCGKPHCRCKDPDHPQRHGPYYKLSYVHRGKNTTEFIRPSSLAAVKRQLATYKQFRKLTDEWVHLALKSAILRLQSSAE